MPFKGHPTCPYCIYILVTINYHFGQFLAIYGHQNIVPILENFEKKPINPYGKTKLDDEILAERYAKQGTSIIGLRYFNVFGKRQSKEYAGVIKLFLDQIKKKESPISINLKRL